MANKQGAWNKSGEPQNVRSFGWKELYQKEDWWAIWFGIGLMALAVILFNSGSHFLSALAVNPGGLKWSSLDQLAAHFANNASMYFLQFVFWMALFGVSCRIMGIKLNEFVPSFIFLYMLSIAIFSVAGWVNAAKFNLEAPLVALVAGLVISNTFSLPKWMDSAFRVEYFIKLGIVLLGATFPITLVLTAGPIAIMQATFISLVTCLIIYFSATRLFGLDRRLAAVIGVGGSVCGVSASMAIAASVGAKKEDLYAFRYPGSGLGAGDDPCSAVCIPRAWPFRRGGRRLDRHFRVCRCGWICRCQHLRKNGWT
jgi:hypothetical protein